jgi:H3 lysine-79-specific histone-lysine N-methyltransferase
VTSLQADVSALDAEKSRFESLRKAEILEACGVTDPCTAQDPQKVDKIVRSFIMEQFSLVLNQRRDLENQVSEYEPVISELEKSIANTSAGKKRTPLGQQAGQQKVPPTSPRVKVKGQGHFQRSRSQEWPEVPNVEQIYEDNPEVLARKILETGRQIELSKVGSKAKVTGGHGVPAASKPVQKPTFVSNLSNSGPKVSFYEDGVKSIITNLLNEGAGSSDLLTREVHPPRARTPPRSETVEKKKKPIQLSPDIMTGYNKGQGPGKLALRAHFMGQGQGSGQGHGLGHGGPRTIQDLVSGEIERSFNIDSSQKKISIPKYSPISRPNSVEATDNRGPGQGQHHQHQSDIPRASVLVSTKRSRSERDPEQPLEGLHARIIAIEQDRVNTGQRSPVQVHHRSKVGGVTEVLLGAVGADNSQSSVSGSGAQGSADSVLRVVRKRLNETQVNSVPAFSYNYWEFFRVLF